MKYSLIYLGKTVGYYYRTTSVGNLITIYEDGTKWEVEFIDKEMRQIDVIPYLE